MQGILGVHSGSSRAPLRVLLARNLVARAEPPPPPSVGAGPRWLHGGGGGGEPEEDEAAPYADVPRPGRRWERKPYVTPMKVLIRRAKEERQARRENPCRVLEHPPDNGLLVPHLVGVAHRVHAAREMLLHGLTRLVEGEDAIPVKRCRFCSEVHVGHVGHEIRTCEGRNSGARNSLHVWRPGTVRDVVGFPYCYHLFDRVGKPRVVHKEKYDVPRLPAILELCIQAGVEVERYPTKRRTRPVYSIEGRIADFEPDDSEAGNSEAGTSSEPPAAACTLLPAPVASMSISSAPTDASNEQEEEEEEITVPELATRTLQAWLDMRSGAARLMKKYSVHTCGYCPEVQVGPKGHKVRMCKATKHQQRDGQHAWQEATVEDLVRPSYVWHVADLGDESPLANELKRYYGKAPAVVELCVQAGAPVPAAYQSMMRLDVVPPARDEYDLVA
ncbi:APO protein 3, mitochondrial [Dichanthelium oligosanthes]|uniref:APO protein 3, mitochondrial n=1 Tax=Dichanthelium oligosanthes TaxID=888268 RepID=A0A1E5VHG2_9POAL|nr:APO protein 3, mitochondrial [Dichanthelium oligosanthes]